MAVFNIFYNEEWHITMYQNALVKPESSFIFYIVSIILCQVLFIRLLQAVYLNEFGKEMDLLENLIPPINYSRTFGQLKMQMKTLFKFKTLQQRSRSRVHSKSIIQIPQDNSQFGSIRRSQKRIINQAQDEVDKNIFN